MSTLSLLVGFPIPFKVTISARLYQSLFRSDRSGSGLYGVWSVLEASCAPLQPSKQKDRLDLVILFVPGGRIGSNCAEPSDSHVVPIHPLGRLCSLFQRYYLRAAHAAHLPGHAGIFRGPVSYRCNLQPGLKFDSSQLSSRSGPSPSRLLLAGARDARCARGLTILVC